MNSRLDRYAGLLLERNRDVNLTGASSLEEVRARHVGDALEGVAALERFFEASGIESPRLVDVGSGGGLPGLVLAIARPSWKVTLVEATGKKCDFLREAIETIGVDNARVFQGRAEELGRDASCRETFDAGVCRAVASLAIGVELVMSFVRVEGMGLFWKGPGVGDELAEGRVACDAVGAELGEPAEYAPSGADADRFFLVPVSKVSPTSERYPRKPARYKRRPYRA